MQACHLMAHVSLTIVAIHDNQDTIRVLDYCNTSIFEKGAKVITQVGKYKEPISIPYTKNVKGTEEIYRSNEFDEVIFRTTYGEIINKQ